MSKQIFARHAGGNDAVKTFEAAIEFFNAQIAVSDFEIVSDLQIQTMRVNDILFNWLTTVSAIVETNDSAEESK